MDKNQIKSSIKALRANTFNAVFDGNPSIFEQQFIKLAVTHAWHKMSLAEQQRFTGYFETTDFEAAQAMMKDLLAEEDVYVISEQIGKSLAKAQKETK